MATTVFDFLDGWNISTHQITSIGLGLAPFTVTFSGSIPVGEKAFCLQAGHSRLGRNQQAIGAKKQDKKP